MQATEAKLWFDNQRWNKGHFSSLAKVALKFRCAKQSKNLIRYLMYTVMHMFRQVLVWAGNQGNHQNFEKKWPKNTKNALFACFWAYVWQPHGHIGWATPMPFASINSTNQRTNPWNFCKKVLRIDDSRKWAFLSRPL